MPAHDNVIKNGLVFGGMQMSGHHGDVGIRNDVIAAINIYLNRRLLRDAGVPIDAV